MVVAVVAVVIVFPVIVHKLKVKSSKRDRIHIYRLSEIQKSGNSA